MRIAHLLLVHEYTPQLQRLVQKLSHAEADIYIHVDKKKPIEQFSALKMPRLFFINNRVKVQWGSFSIVQATLNGFQSILASGKEYGYINLLSGQDYPLQPVKTIHDFFDKHPGKAFMEYYTVSDVWTEAIPRITRYHLADYTFAGRYAVEKLMNKVLPQRKMPYDLTAVGRSQWFSITLAHARYIMEYVKTNPRIVKFFKLSWAPDELFFQTILYNSPHKKDMVNDSLRYIDWSEKKASPKTFTLADMPVLTASGKLYARKFNAGVDAKVLDELDKITVGA
jgi:hypothetical protein